MRSTEELEKNIISGTGKPIFKTASVGRRDFLF